MNKTSCVGRVTDSRGTASDSANGPTPEVSVIIVNWNSKDFLRRCLQSIYRHSRSIVFEVVVVDNGSFDGCDEMLTQEFPAIVFLQSAENIGFGRANNLGASHSRGSYLFFLNPDTELIEDSLTLLRDHLESLPDAGAISCRLLNSDRTLQIACVQSFPTVLNQLLDSDFLRGRFPHSTLWGTAALHSQSAEAVKVELVSGACIVVKREVFDQVGGFTESYFMYGEDLDLCFKIRRAGYGVYHTAGTNIIHHGGGSSRRSTHDFSNAMTRESVFRFLRLNRGVATACLYRMTMAGAALIRMPLIIGLLALGRSGLRPLRKWLSILRWSLGFESRALANVYKTNKYQDANLPTAVIPLERSASQVPNR